MNYMVCILLPRVIRETPKPLPVMFPLIEVLMLPLVPLFVLGAVSVLRMPP
jgi:hypothetical protein